MVCWPNWPSWRNSKHFKTRRSLSDLYKENIQNILAIFSTVNSMVVFLVNCRGALPLRKKNPKSQGRIFCSFSLQILQIPCKKKLAMNITFWIGHPVDVIKAKGTKKWVIYFLRAPTNWGLNRDIFYLLLLHFATFWFMNYV